MQNFSSFGPFLEKIGLNSPNNGRQLQPNEARSQNLDKSLFIIGPEEAVSSSGLKKGAPQFQLGNIVCRSKELIPYWNDNIDATSCASTCYMLNTRFEGIELVTMQRASQKDERCKNDKPKILSCTLIWFWVHHPINSFNIINFLFCSCVCKLRIWRFPIGWKCGRRK